MSAKSAKRERHLKSGPRITAAERAAAFHRSHGNCWVCGADLDPFVGWASVVLAETGRIAVCQRRCSQLCPKDSSIEEVREKVRSRVAFHLGYIEPFERILDVPIDQLIEALDGGPVFYGERLEEREKEQRHAD